MPVTILLDAATISSHHAQGDNAFGLHCSEVFGHSRIEATTIDTFAVPTQPGVLVLAECPALSDQHVTELAAWVSAGGQLVVTAAHESCAELAGVSLGDSHPEGGLVQFGETWSQRPPRAIRAVAGHSLVPLPETDVRAEWVRDDQVIGAAITHRTVGQGSVFCYGVGLWETLVRLLQGFPVHEDHVGSLDGSAPMDEGILKCEDGMAFDVEQDRRTTSGALVAPEGYTYAVPPELEPPIFNLPQTDLWVSSFLQAIWEGLDRTDSAHGWLHYWPGSIPAVAHMSHDSDGNQDDDGQAALDAFAEADVKVTWCQVYHAHAYAPEIYDKITAAGHEHALHYNAMADADIAQWGESQFKGQYAWAQKITGVDDIVSNKNHYTRWEGWIDFYRWCEDVGIQIDESRGPSKQGTVGFTFGTAHVGFPMGDVELANRPMNVLNLPLHVQDLEWAGHITCRDVILDGALEVHGVAHFLFHGPWLRQKPPTRAACREVAAEARRRGMQWWTARQINDWERLRRGVTVQVSAESGVTITSIAPVADAGILLALKEKSPVTLIAADGSSVTTTLTQRHGRSWHEAILTVPAGTSTWTIQQ